MKTAEDVVQKLIEMTNRDELPWRKLEERMGELNRYAVEHNKVAFVLDVHGDGTKCLRVNSVEIYQEVGNLTVLGVCVYRSLVRQAVRYTAETQEDAIRKAVVALQ